MEDYKNDTFPQQARVDAGCDRLRSGDTLMARFGSTMVTAQPRESDDFVVGRSKNGSFVTNTYDDPRRASAAFDRWRLEEA
jgi:hypothetical protein